MDVFLIDSSMTNKQYEEMDALINAELDAEELADRRNERVAALYASEYHPRNAYGLDRDDVQTLREWGII